MSNTTTYIEHRFDGPDTGEKWHNDFRQYVPRPGHPRIKGLNHATVHEYSKDVLSRPKPQELFTPWFRNWEEPFIGITSDGRKQEGLGQLKDEGAPAVEMVAAANAIITNLTSEERRKCCYEIDAPEWRKWANPEIMFNDIGIRLETLEQQKRDLVLRLLQSSLSPHGYQKALDAMRTNQFLGELVNARSIMNEYSYHFLLFGSPSEHEPWGFSLFGHHLCLNILVVKNQMVLSPVFIGAEPNTIDVGAYKGTELFVDEASIALALMQSLPPHLQSHAQTYRKMHDVGMPVGRWHPADQRQLGGCSQDNRIIPYEGILATSMPDPQQADLLNLLATYYAILPDGPLNARMAQIHAHWRETYFSWIGGFGDDDPFYYRVQSPVVMVEFDHHAGVFLLNSEPAKCHTHTIMRMPNGGDYGKEVLEAWRKGQYHSDAL